MIKMLTIYEDEIINELESAVAEAVNDKCKYYASDIINFLKLDTFSFNEALSMTEKALMTLNLPLKYNIKNIYRATEGGIAGDLKLSPLATYFLSIHCNPENPRVANLQFYLAKKYNF